VLAVSGSGKKLMVDDEPIYLLPAQGARYRKWKRNPLNSARHVWRPEKSGKKPSGYNFCGQENRPSGEEVAPL